MSKKKISMLVLLALVAVLAVYTIMNPADMSDTQGYVSRFHAGFLSLLPPVVAIVLALITKEVYSSLFVGIIKGALLYYDFNLELMIQNMFFQ